MEDNIKKDLTKEERERLHQQQIEEKIKSEKSKKLTKRILFYSIILIIIIGLVYAGIFSSAKPGKYDDFVKCLTEKGVKEYGAFWCSSCAEQKKLFGKSFKYITYVECDARGSNAQPGLCQKENIKGYPTWSIDNTKYEGVRSLDELAELSGCQLKN